MERAEYFRITVGVAAATAGVLIVGQQRAHAEGNELPSPDVPQESTTTPESPATPQPSIDEEDSEYTVSGGETLEGVAARMGVSVEALKAVNPSVADADGGDLQSGSVLVVPTSQVAVSPEAVATEPERVVFSNGISVVSPVGPEPQEQQQASIQQITTEQSAAPVESFSAPVVQPVFVDVPFQKAETFQSVAAIDDPRPNTQMLEVQPAMQTMQLVANEPTLPLEITTNAPSTVRIDSTGVYVEVAAISTPDKAPITTPEPVHALTAASQEVQQSPAIAETQTDASYESFLATVPIPPDPPQVLELKDVSVYDRDGLLRRSKAYQEKMDWLEDATSPLVSTEGYNAFKANGINTSYASLNIFASELPGKKLDELRCYTIHWTAGITEDPKAAAEAMLNRDKTANVQLMTMPNGVPYLFTETIDTMAYHATSANKTCVGNEIVANDLLDFTPQQTLTNIYLTLYLHQYYGMPLARDIAKIEAQPRNQYGDFVPLDYGDNLVGPIGHLEVPDSGKLDPTVMYVNYVYKEAQRLKQMIDEGGPLPLPETAPEPEAPDDTGVPQLPPQVLPTPQSGSEDGISIQWLLAQPVLTQEQAALLNRSDMYGFGPVSSDPMLAPESPKSETPENSQSIPVLPEKIQSLLSEQAKTYQPVPVDTARQRSEQSVQNGGTLTFEQAYGPTMPAEDVYLYLRSAGATHIEAVTLTAVAVRETGLRPASVGDLRPINGKVLPSYGLFQIRDLQNGDPRRDPQANMHPQTAAQNAFALYKESGLEPWETTMPSQLTVSELYEAIRLPNRNLTDAKRTATNERAMEIATNLIPQLDAMQEKLNATTGGAV